MILLELGKVLPKINNDIGEIDIAEIRKTLYPISTIITLPNTPINLAINSNSYIMKSVPKIKTLFPELDKFQASIIFRIYLYTHLFDDDNSTSQKILSLYNQLINYKRPTNELDLSSHLNPEDISILPTLGVNRG